MVGAAETVESAFGSAKVGAAKAVVVSGLSSDVFLYRSSTEPLERPFNLDENA
ncbi:hypothetical protein HanXRQr2_Chr02g0061381 [Helianthus annuus]|uniref:Uncharacterized protein n=1 Tax=Helianthus annuus TaxID=4232 RepID=A0A9K3JM15_HELAN|nr:hypothetical protein HanXRQr2_Chr02g0061381 [Helianthus annuus]